MCSALSLVCRAMCSVAPRHGFDAILIVLHKSGNQKGVTKMQSAWSQLKLCRLGSGPEMEGVD
jgi:hypothetical protein